jgi:hypothetical protein
VRPTWSIFLSLQNFWNVLFINSWSRSVLKISGKKSLSFDIDSKAKVPRVNYQSDGDLMDLSNIKVPRVNYQWDGDLMDLSNIKVPRVNYQWDGDLMGLSNIKVPRVNYQWDGDLIDHPTDN